jgi:hypothetical protein
MMRSCLLCVTCNDARRRALVLVLSLGMACLTGIASAFGQTAPVFTEVPPTQLDLTPDQQRILDKIRNEPATAEVAVVRLNAEELRPGPTPLRMFSNRDVTVALPETQARGAGATTLSSGPAQPHGSAMLVVRGVLVTGRVVSGNRIYSIRPLGDGLHTPSSRLTRRDSRPSIPRASIDWSGPRRTRHPPRNGGVTLRPATSSRSSTCSWPTRRR